VIGQDAFGGGPVLLFQIFHSAARQVLGAPEERPSGGPCSCSPTWWGTVPGSRRGRDLMGKRPVVGGACTHIPGSPACRRRPAGRADWRPPAVRREHTQSARLAYADGAMTSGIREAQRLSAGPASASDRSSLPVARTVVSLTGQLSKHSPEMAPD
jgi:hypothetical protein